MQTTRTKSPALRRLPPYPLLHFYSTLWWSIYYSGYYPQFIGLMSVQIFGACKQEIKNSCTPRDCTYTYAIHQFTHMLSIWLPLGGLLSLGVYILITNSCLQPSFVYFLKYEQCLIKPANLNNSLSSSNCHCQNWIFELEIGQPSYLRGFIIAPLFC